MVSFVNFLLVFVQILLLQVRSAWAAGLVVDDLSANFPKVGRQETLQCLTLLYGRGRRRNFTSIVNLTEYDELWKSTPAFRLIGLCPNADDSMVGSLVELRAHLNILYTNADGQQNCKIIRLTTPSKTAFDEKRNKGSLMGFPRNANRSAYMKIQGNLSTLNPAYHRNLSTVDILTEIEFTECSNKTRRLGLFVDVEGDAKPWKLELIWRRQPEYYEVGEVGWSSVGAHRGALSGTFSLTELNISYHLDGGVFDNVHPSIVNMSLVAESENASRFRARAGDFYQCESDRYIVLSTPPPSNKLTNQSILPQERVHIIFATRDLRLQAFSDLNLNEFSGAGVTCSDDVHEDHSITIGIGTSVFVLVVVVIFGIIFTRLYDRDKELQTYESEQGWDPTNPRKPPFVYPLSSQSKKRKRQEKQKHTKKKKHDNLSTTIKTKQDQESQNVNLLVA